jgi:hypothetical protein
VPNLFEFTGPTPTRLSSGLFTASGFGLLGRGPAHSAPPDAADAPFDLYVWSFGPDPAPAAARLRALLAAWQAAGRPGSAGLRLSVYDRAAPPPPVDAHSVIVEKPATRLVLTFPA